jgi:S1-C subfamily serine protease
MNLGIFENPVPSAFYPIDFKFPLCFECFICFAQNTNLENSVRRGEIQKKCDFFSFWGFIVVSCFVVTIIVFRKFTVKAVTPAVTVSAFGETNGNLRMNCFFASFGIFEWILAGTLTGLLLYALYSHFRSIKPEHLRKYSCLLPVIVPLLFLLLPFCGPQEPGARFAAHDNIRPYVSASLSNHGDTNPSFTNVSAMEGVLYRSVSDVKKDNSVSAEASNVSQRHSEKPTPYDGFVRAPRPLSSESGIVSADLLSSRNSADTIRPAGFLAPSGNVAPRPLGSAERAAADLPAEATTPMTADLIAKGLETAKLASVHIEAKVYKNGSKASRETIETGSGVIIMTRPGDFYVLTNNHVAGNPVSNDQVNIVLNDRRQVHPTRVISSVEFDLAVLQLDKKDILPPKYQNADGQTLHNLFASPDADVSWNPATLGNSDTVRVTESVWAIGSPFGLEGTITGGIVSALDRRQVPLGTENQIQGFIQTDASVNPGNSGGPLVNARGEVIGIVLAIASQKGESSGVSFAIPINNAILAAEQLIRDGIYKRPYIGVQLDRKFATSEKIREGLLLESTSIAGTTKRAGGARVSGVVPGSPAAKAGLRGGDIILRFNNRAIEDEQHFEHMICLSKINDAPNIEILREGRLYSVSPRLTDREKISARNVSE